MNQFFSGLKNSFKTLCFQTIKCSGHSKNQVLFGVSGNQKKWFQITLAIAFSKQY